VPVESMIELMGVNPVLTLGGSEGQREGTEVHTWDIDCFLRRTGSALVLQHVKDAAL
jgi:hypothetical protein